LIGFRYWDIGYRSGIIPRPGPLWSPISRRQNLELLRPPDNADRIALPDDGVLTAWCDRHTDVPAEGCWCGVYFYESLEVFEPITDMPDVAVTVGEVLGNVLADPYPPLVVTGETQHMAPMATASSWRCAAYKVLGIYAQLRVLIQPYPVPVTTSLARLKDFARA
jgi:hypothetical protein